MRAWIDAESWRFASWCMLRTIAILSITRASPGRCSQICTPGTAVEIEANSPRMSAGADGFMSNVSRWLGPPYQKRRMQARMGRATATSAPATRARRSPLSDSPSPPPIPAPMERSRNARRPRPRPMVRVGLLIPRLIGRGSRDHGSTVDGGRFAGRQRNLIGRGQVGDEVTDVIVRELRQQTFGHQ